MATSAFQKFKDRITHKKNDDQQCEMLVSNGPSSSDPAHGARSQGDGSLPTTEPRLDGTVGGGNSSNSNAPLNGALSLLSRWA